MPQNDLHKPPNSTSCTQLYVGCAGWSIPADYATQFPGEGTHLERYARVLPAVEINSSFYRPHKVATYELWATSVPDDFRFAVKMPKSITHTQRLKNMDAELDDFLAECGGLGSKLGPLLVQLPPSLIFRKETASTFFDTVRSRFSGSVVCEPRHASWFAEEADNLLTDFEIARVAADPDVPKGASEPGGWDGLVYYRLHGSPHMYYSAYSQEYLQALSQNLQAALERKAQAWCIFDNTAAFEATGNALALLEMAKAWV